MIKHTKDQRDLLNMPCELRTVRRNKEATLLKEIK